MVCVILGVVFLFIGVIFLLSFNISKNSEEQFKKNAYFTQGTVIGRKLYSDGYMDEYYINVVDESGVEKEYLSQSFRPVVPNIEPGTIIDVALAKKTTLGIKTYELKVVDERYVKPQKIRLANALKAITIFSFILSLIFFVLNLI